MVKKFILYVNVFCEEIKKKENNFPPQNLNTKLRKHYF